MNTGSLVQLGNFLGLYLRTMHVKNRLSFIISIIYTCNKPIIHFKSRLEASIIKVRLDNFLLSFLFSRLDW